MKYTESWGARNFPGLFPIIFSRVELDYVSVHDMFLYFYKSMTPDIYRGMISHFEKMYFLWYLEIIRNLVLWIKYEIENIERGET